jgi:hypothetical protein
MIPADIDIGSEDSPAAPRLRPTVGRTARLHPVLVVTGGGRTARHDPDRRPVLPVAGAIRRVDHGCPHCVGLTGSCCQCHGSRVVSADVAQHNGNWLWAFADCTCQACRKLTIMRDAIVEPEPVHARGKGDGQTIPVSAARGVPLRERP